MKSSKAIMWFFISLVLSSCSSTAGLPVAKESLQDLSKVVYADSTDMRVEVNSVKAKKVQAVLTVKANIVNKTFSPNRDVWVEAMTVFKASDNSECHRSKWYPLLVKRGVNTQYSVVCKNEKAEDYVIHIKNH